MQAKIVGFKTYDFKDKNGNQISGKKFFVTYKDKNVNGLATMEFNISRSHDSFESVDKLLLNDDVNIFYNQYGKIDNVVKA